MLLATGMALNFCEDDEQDVETEYDSPVMLLKNQPPKRVIIVGEGVLRLDRTEWFILTNGGSDSVLERWLRQLTVNIGRSGIFFSKTE